MRPLNKYRQAKTPEEYLNQRSEYLENGCIIFTAGKDKDGYGQCHSSKVAKLLGVTRAHQLAYVAKYGKIPKGNIICHTCDNPSCINPDHLFSGSVLDNNMDKIKKGRENSAKGSRNARAKLTESQVLEIRELQGKLASNIVGRMYNVSFSRVCAIWRKDGWRHL